MIRVAVDIDVVGLVRLQTVARELPDTVKTFAKAEVRPFVSYLVDARLQRYPGDVVYPIEWATVKQMLYFFWTNGFGKGIPYQRTGKLIRDWHVRGDYEDGFSGITVYNDNPAAMYVYGDEQGEHQQPFHVNTGWPTFEEELIIINNDTNQFIEDRWPLVVDNALQAAA